MQYAGTCKCPWCATNTWGEFQRISGGLAHYRCGYCHLYYSHEIAELEDEDADRRYTGEEAVVSVVQNYHAGSF